MPTAPSARYRSGWLRPALVGVLLLAAGVVVYLVWLRPKPPTPEVAAPDLVGAMAANTRGVGLMEMFLYSKAEPEFAEAGRLAPNWAPARVNLGIALMNENQEDTKARAADLFREILAKDGDNKHAHYCLGILLYDQGKLQEAYEQFAAVNRLDPDDAYTWLRLGTCHPGGRDSKEARECLEKALKLNPYLNEARFRLVGIYRVVDPDRVGPLHEQWEALRAADWIALSGIKYSEMGKYADVIGRDPSAGGKPAVGPVPMFDTATRLQLNLETGARWATAADLDPIRRAARERFGGAVVLFDYNRDGKPDVFLPSAVFQNGNVRDLLLRNDGNNTFTDVTTAAGLATSRPSLGAAAGDYDNDGFADLVVTGAGEQHLFRNKGDGTFEDVSAKAGLDAVKGVCLGCAWVDLDQDGDLDLLLCQYAASVDGVAGFAGMRPNGGGLLAFENQGVAPPAPMNSPQPPLTTKFKPDPRPGGAAGASAAVGLVASDVDGDQDIDLVVLSDRGAPTIVLNDRLMRFHREVPAWAAAGEHSWNGGLVLDANHDERSDLFLVRTDGPPAYLLSHGARDFTGGNTNSPPLRQAAAVDIDMDGWTDVVGLGADGKPVLLHNQADGRLEVKSGAFGELPRCVGLGVADVDGDGAPDILFWTEGGLQLLRNLGNGNRALHIDPSGFRRTRPGEPLPGSERTNADGIGCWVAAQSGSTWTGAERTTTAAGLGQSVLPTLLGLGKAEQADVVRLRWPDGVIQAEMVAHSGRVHRIVEFDRKPTSCPLLLTWDGERFVFVTDFLGAGSMGELAADGSTRPPRPEESVKIEPGLLKLKDGQYVLKIAEPMDEVLYLDHLRLDVVDHPAGVAVFPDERFATSDPQPTQELLAFRDRRFPRKAIDHRGNDVTKLVLERDRRAPENLHLRSWLGFAEDHSLTFDFGDVPAGKSWHLVMAGWTEYPYPESIYAAERAKVPLQFPVLERLSADGKTWESLGDLGFPAGLPRVMTRPLPDLKPGPCVLRFRTNMQVYCDQVYLAPAADVGIKVHTLDVRTADLAARGFIQEILPGGRPPIAYDDAKTESIPITKWKGKLTRTGDVTELLTAADDRFVVCGPGDEVTVRFDAAKLPPVPAGWARSFVLRSRGYSKDTAPYTATGGNVLPLPFRAMKNYPDFGGATPPTTDAAKWNTRPVGGR